MKRNILCLMASIMSFYAIGQSLIVEVHAEHSGMVGDSDLTGMTTYRVYIQLDDADDIPYIVFGNADNPLEINTSTAFFQHPLGALLGDLRNPLFFGVDSSTLYDSFVTIGAEDNTTPLGTLALGTGVTQWTDDFEAGGNIVIDDPVGGGWFCQPPVYGTLPPGENGKYLVAQLTTDGDLSGVLNLDYQDNFDDQPISIQGEVQAALGLTFSSGPSGAPGDFNGDESINFSDVLLFLGAFGCNTDCDPYDLDGDGNVLISDLLLLISYL